MTSASRGFDEWQIGEILLRHKPYLHPSRYVIAGTLFTSGNASRDGGSAIASQPFGFRLKRCSAIPQLRSLTRFGVFVAEQNDRVTFDSSGG